ncbi:hypothetical protein HER32_15655 [Hymenobacter sp. BT18]|uniref:hypothetical protein n=1 Tax=Hymenobacter sp. BT18 TaxID=2835648 RepID=UPI00143EEF35|nr:hypothetical protein [Hymenobacter sp. BT18]QIX62535.1 hypothetical protein HER32_15655 [Hymenobacter sp. BT18]
MAFGLNVLNVLVFARHSVSLQRFAAGVLLMLVVVGLIVYRRLQIIREMEQQQANVFDVLNSRIVQFRQLMRLHDYVGVVSLVILVITVVVVRFKDLRAYLNAPQPDGNWHLLVAVGVALAVVGVIYAAFVVGKREHQRRYGRHLDQLEAALRELEDVR